MNDTQYTTLLQLITNVSSRIDSLLPAVKNEMKKEMKKHEHRCDKRRLELMKVLETPFLDHEKRIKEIELAPHLQ